MSIENMYYSTRDAAAALADASRSLRKLEADAEQYYSLPYGLERDIARETRRIRDAVRFLVSEEADE
jgi:hypothetical protein